MKKQSFGAMASVVVLFVAMIGGCGRCDQGEVDDPCEKGVQSPWFDPPGSTPKPFLAELIRTNQAEIALAVSPRNDEFLFTRAFFDESGIHFSLHVSILVDGLWTAPQPVPFASELGEAEAFYDPSGDRLFFFSSRPRPGTEDPPRAMNLWFVEREREAWGEPVFIGKPDAPIEYGWSGSMLDDQTFFFTARPYEELGLADIYRVPISDDRFGVAETIGPPVNTPEYTENEPAIAPTDSYLVFYSAGRPDNLSAELLGDLYISFRQSDGTWGEPQHIDEPINSPAEENWPRISHDGKYLFFSSSRREGVELPDLYWVSTDALEKYRSPVPPVD